MEHKLLEDVKQAVSELRELPNVSRPSPDEIRKRAEEIGTRTIYGNYNWVSTVKNRSVALTVHLGSSRVTTDASTQKRKDIKKGAAETVALVHKYLRKAPLINIKCTMGDNPSFAPKCNLYLSTYRKETMRLAHKLLQTLFPAKDTIGPELTVVFIPEWHEKDRQILVFPEIGVTYVLGTDYYGELKNAFLRMAMWNAKQEGMLGLHAGTKIVRARGEDGRIRKLGIIMFGIAATGKTTHICNDHGLHDPGESVEIVQDEVAFWRKDGCVLGSERGFYIKAESLNPDVQPLLYNAAISPNAVLDNVMVDYDGNVYFDDRTLTANGHVIIQRDDMGSFASSTINLPPLDEVDGLIMAFMSRNYTVVPVASRLTPEQAAVAFMLGESLDVTGADAKDAISSPKAAGTNPLLVGEPADEANRFYEFVKANSDKVQCYMLNTGGVGEWVEHGLDGARKVQRKVTRVTIPEMAAIMRGIARGTIRWREDPHWIVETPEYVEGIDISKFELDKHYVQAKIYSLITSIRMERASYAEQFIGLNPAITEAVEF